MLSCHYLIFGKVQGVGYRAFAQKAAKSFGLKGRARNLNDGRVEILAMGTKQNLEGFEKILRQGPPHARVESVAVTSLNTAVFEMDFILLPDGEKTWL